LRHGFNDKFDQVLRSTLVFEKAFELQGMKSWLDVDKSEATTESIVYRCKASVSRIHQAYDVEIGWDVELFVVAIGIGEDDFIFWGTLVLFNQHQKLTKDLTQVASVDFVNDAEVIVLGIPVCRLA
jgi:hypothetical protein